jgi:hypothetical protein
MGQSLPLPRVPTKDDDVNLLQDKWIPPLTTLLKAPTTGAKLIQNVKLFPSNQAISLSGAPYNTINHGLGRPLVGWQVVRYHQPNLPLSSVINPGAYGLGYTGFSFLGTWAYFGSLVFPQLQVDGNGNVRLLGYVANASAITPPSNIMQLPAVYAPATTLSFVAYGAWASQANNTFRVDVAPSGIVTCNAVLTSPTGAITAAPQAIPYICLNTSWLAAGVSSNNAPSGAAAPSVGDVQDFNPYPDKTLWLTTPAGCVVDLLAY